MCHANPLERSRLLLSEVDQILMPFFKNDTKKKNSNNRRRGSSTSSSSTNRSDVADRITCQPLNDPERPDVDSQVEQEKGGEGGRDGEAAGGSGRPESAPGRERNSRVCSATSAAVSVADLVGELAPIPTPPDPHLKPIPSSPIEQSPKRIRFTGVIGEFLDSATVWSDFAVMEAERKASQQQQQEEAKQEPSEESHKQPTTTSPPHVARATREGGEHQPEAEVQRQVADIQSAGRIRGSGRRREDLLVAADVQQKLQQQPASGV